MKNKISILSSLFLILHIGFSPLLWLPEVSDSKMRVFKIIICTFSFTLFFIFTLLNRKILIPKHYKIFILLIILFFIPYFIFSDDLNGALNYFLNYIFSAIAVLIGINSKNTVIEKSYIYKILFIWVVVIALFPCIYFFTGYPDWNEWIPLSEYNIINKTTKLFWSAGFNGNRTGWSESIAIFIPFSSLFIFTKKKYSIIPLVTTCFPILLAQIISNGRNGLMASLFAIIVISVINGGLFRLFKSFVVICIIFVGFFIQYSEDILIALRIYDASGTLNDNLSSSRTLMYDAFFDIFLEDPFFGKGFLGSQKALFPKYIYEDGLEMHSSILRILIDHGLFFGLLIIILIIFAFKIAIHHLLNPYESLLNKSFSIILIQGILISLFQPLSLFGGFQPSAIWWLSLGILMQSYLYNYTTKPPLYLSSSNL